VDARAGRGAGRYDRTMLGIFPVGDLTEVVEADADASAVILEEPEHCASHPTRRCWRSAPLLLLGPCCSCAAGPPRDPRESTFSWCLTCLINEPLWTSGLGECICFSCKQAVL
jgi:hypothetical protein